MHEYEIIPRGWFQRRLEVRGPGGRHLTVERNCWTNHGVFDVDGRRFDFRVRTRWSGIRYALEQAGELVARANPRGFLQAGLELELFGPEAPSAPIPFERRSFWCAKYALEGEPPFQARLESRGAFAWGQRVLAHSDLPVELVVFLGLVGNSIAMHNATVVGGAGGVAAVIGT